jgi:CPA2 family monovalent cation:H+ antiporter-2
MLIILPTLGNLQAGMMQLGSSVLLAALFLAVMIFVGTRVMPWLLRIITGWNSRELFLVAVVAIGVGVGYATYLVGLSFAFGAFVAGMVLSESDYSHQALSDIIPLRDVFGILFFVSVGMLIDPNFILVNIGAVVGAVLIVMLGKALIFGVITRSLGYGNAAPLIVGLGLFQVGEFSFVLARVGVSDGAVSEELFSLVLAVAVISMILTPPVSQLALPLYNLWRRYRPHEALTTFNLPAANMSNHVIVAGYGRSGRAAASVMQRVGLDFVVIELDQRVAERCKADGVPAIFGDATSSTVLNAAGISHARLLLISMPEAIGVQLIAQRVRQENPGLHIVARAADVEHMMELKNLGVYEVVQPELEAGLEMVRQVLVHFRVNPTDIQRYSESVHKEFYAPLYAGDEHGHQPAVPRDGSSARLLRQIRRVSGSFEIEWITLPENSPLVGQTLGAAAIRHRTGASVVAVLRDEGLSTNPGAEHVFEADETLAVVGSPEQCDALRTLVEANLPPDKQERSTALSPEIELPR